MSLQHPKRSVFHTTLRGIGLATTVCALTVGVLGCGPSATDSGAPVNDAAAAANMPGGSGAGAPGAAPAAPSGPNDAAAAANTPK